jgi:hypothetical protein
MRAFRAALLILTLPLVACAAKSGAQAPAAGVAVSDPEASLDQYLALLERSEEDLRAQGVDLPLQLARAETKRLDGERRASEDLAPSAPAGADVPAASPSADATVADEGDAVSGPSPANDMPTGGADAEAPPPEPSPAVEEEQAGAGERENVARDQAAPGPARASKRKHESRNARDRCELVCNLTESTCDLEALICELARRHDEDPRYDQACERAETDCAVAQEACLGCSG